MELDLPNPPLIGPKVRRGYRHLGDTWRMESPQRFWWGGNERSGPEVSLLLQQSAATAPDLGRGESPFVRSSCAMQPLLLCQLCVLRITFMVLFLSVKIDNHTFHIFSLLKVYSLCPSIKKNVYLVLKGMFEF